ncbi:hypothetical protein LTR64_007978 [Lithohypha guttulata]|uniref:uncharacterized protein n=1 Tax=Lithohypha guttulata TaxID=1690604 RepID=UPI002DDE9A97|nr:hypothetical protein LTR51_008153 [Lithohypha guttulata]
MILKQLNECGVSPTTGFVPETSSEPLPEYYNAWEEIVANLPRLLKEASLINALALLPALETDHLSSESDWQRAYVLLGFIIHGLVHGAKQKNIPASLAEPFLRVCEHLGVQPVLSYAGLCLYNWQDAEDKNTLSGMRTIASFTGTLDEEAFYLVPVLVERAAGRLPGQLLQAVASAQRDQWDKVANYLDTCSAILKHMVNALSELNLCRPDVFYHDIRPYIGGIDVALERHDEEESIHVKLVGGSAGQSSLFQFLDHVLGIKHESTLLQEMRAYMPRGHRQFLIDVKRLPSLVDLAVAGSASASHSILPKLEKCRLELKKWRDKHISVVARYVMLPAQEAARRLEGGAMKVTGTAGSSPIQFLKQARDETVLLYDNSSHYALPVG